MKENVAEKVGVITGGGLLGRLALAQQQRLLDAFQEFSRSGGAVLDVRPLADAPEQQAMVGFTELADQPFRMKVIAHRVQLASLRKGSMVKMGESFSLPFADGEFDWACSSGVIEHMGNRERQFNLVREMARVAKKGAFVVAPNRGHPINFSSTRRSQMLLAQDLYRIAGLLPGQPEYDVGHKRIFGIKGHFFLMISKNPAIK